MLYHNSQNFPVYSPKKAHKRNSSETPYEPRHGKAVRLHKKDVGTKKKGREGASLPWDRASSPILDGGEPHMNLSPERFAFEKGKTRDGGTAPPVPNQAGTSCFPRETKGHMVGNVQCFQRKRLMKEEHAVQSLGQHGRMFLLAANHLPSQRNRQRILILYPHIGIAICVAHILVSGIFFNKICPRA